MFQTRYSGAGVATMSYVTLYISKVYRLCGVGLRGASLGPNIAVTPGGGGYLYSLVAHLATLL